MFPMHWSKGQGTPVEVKGYQKGTEGSSRGHVVTVGVRGEEGRSRSNNGGQRVAVEVTSNSRGQGVAVEVT